MPSKNFEKNICKVYWKEFYQEQKQTRLKKLKDLELKKRTQSSPILNASQADMRDNSMINADQSLLRLQAYMTSNTNLETISLPHESFSEINLLHNSQKYTKHNRSLNPPYLQSNQDPSFPRSPEHHHQNSSMNINSPPLEYIGNHGQTRYQRNSSMNRPRRRLQSQDLVIPGVALQPRIDPNLSQGNHHSRR